MGSFYHRGELPKYEILICGTTIETNSKLSYYYNTDEDFDYSHDYPLKDEDGNFVLVNDVDSDPGCVVYSNDSKQFCFYNAPLHDMNHYAFAMKDNVNLVTVEKFDISSMYPKLISLDHCFSGCTSLESVNLSNLCPPNCERLFGMFKGCENLVEVDFSNCGFDGHTATEGLFQGAPSLERVRVSNCNEDFINSLIYELREVGYDESLIEY